MDHPKTIHTVYIVFNLLNGSFYIGYHSTTNKDDDYLGSGVRIQNAVRKYKKSNFKKFVVFVSEEARFALEVERVLIERFLGDKRCYNIVPGGLGGSGAGRLGAIATNQKYPREVRAQWLKNRKASPEFKEKLKRLHGSGHKFFHGEKHSEETKMMMSWKAKKRSEDPSSNSQFGTMWITNGLQNQKIKKGSPLPAGWVAGRTCRSSSVGRATHS